MSASSSEKDLARTAFVYAFPLVFNLRQMQRYVATGIGANPAAAYNTFSHARTLAGPEDRFVTINNDTVYSMAQLDVSRGPLVLEVPDTAGRYYVLQLVSAWTENFAYVGRRATGTRAGRYLLAPPGWRGDPPPDAVVIELPTHLASVVGRWAVDGPGDLSAVHALQDAVRLEPLVPGGAPARGLPDVPPLGDEALDFWEAYRTWSRVVAPPSRDRALQSGFAPLGLVGETSVAEAPDPVRQALRLAYDEGQEYLASALRGGHVPDVNGWQMALHAFDYNVEHLGLGTVDAPEWRIEDQSERHLMRAGAALGGLWGNHGYEAAYAGCYVDDRREQLTGSRTYRLTLDPPPPNDAFWSLTMYDVPDYYLVPNPIERYSVGDRTPGLVRGPGASVSITMSHRRPNDLEASSNWLPAPAGDFRPMLRIYTPGRAVLDGTYELPPIVRVEEEQA